MENADLILLIGTNPRYEAPLLNSRIRKAYVHKECDVAYIGPQIDLTYKYTVIIKFRILCFLSIYNKLFFRLLAFR